MAILKDLIVNGASRFIGDAYFNIIKAGVWNGTAIDVAHGGTGLTSLSSGYLLEGKTSSIMQARAITTSITSGSTGIPTSGAVYEAISAGFAANGAMVFKGTYTAQVSSSSSVVTSGFSTLPGSASLGWTWIVTGNNSYFGNIVVEAGDMIISKTSNPGTTISNYYVIQTNIDVTHYVTTNTAQTITGAKTFNAETTFNKQATFNKGLISTSIGDSDTDVLFVSGNSSFNDIVNIYGLTNHGNHVIPMNNNAYDLGSSSLKWRNVYAGSVTATTFTGSLSGNASTATTATNLSSKPSFTTYASDTTKITLTAGGKTSDAYTVPYATYSNTVKGAYTIGGGLLNPNYFGTNRVGFLMMNTTVNGNSNYKDWMIMDCYNNNDVGGGVAFGVNRLHLGAYIMRSESARTSWTESAELYGTHNLTKSVVTGLIGSLTYAPYNANGYLPLSGGIMTGNLYLKGSANLVTNSRGSYANGIRINRSATSNWAGMTIGYVSSDQNGGGTGSDSHTWMIATPGSSDYLNISQNGNISTSTGLTLQGHGNNLLKWNNNTIYHAGNLPAYPTKDSWNYDDRYVSSLTTSGNYLRWVKNGSNNDITIPYATSASYATYLSPGSYTPTDNTVAGHKAGLVNWLKTNNSNSIGNNVIVSLSIIGNWDNDMASYYNSSVYAMTKIGGGYYGSTYGQWLLSSYNTTRIGVVGRSLDSWSSIYWLAWTSDIPTKVSQLTNDAEYVTSSDVTSSLSNYVLKKPNTHFYNYIGCSFGSTWYKITLPFHNITLTTNRWIMVSMELILKGNYSNGADGTIYLSYYIYYAANDNVGEATKVYGVAIGSNMNDVRVTYLKTDLGILYVYVPNNYNSFAIQNLSANDTAVNYNFLTTTIEPLSSSNYPVDSTIQDVNIRKLYTIDGTSLSLNGKTLIDSGNISSQSVNYAVSAGKATNDSDGNAINSTYLKKSGGTLTGNLIMNTGNNTENIVKFVLNRAKESGGGWAVNSISWTNSSNTSLANISVFGSDSALSYLYLGQDTSYNSDHNLRIYSDKITFGSNTIWHAGNYTSWINTTNYPGLNKVGTVTSVGIIAGTGISVSNSPITSSGNITVTNSGVSFMITPGDNRSVATTPNDYHNKIIFLGLKNKSTIGSPSNDAYSYLVGLRGWSDSSGGKSHEFAFNDAGIYRRVGSTTSWESWIRIADSGNSSLSTSSNVVSLKLLNLTASVYNTSYIDNLSLYANKSTTTSSITLIPTEWKQLCQLSATTLLSSNYGTYVVQITKGTGSSFVFIGSGIMSYGSTNSAALEEIVLHCYGGDDNRLYLGTQNGYLMGAAKVSLGATQYTITFKRII